MNEEKSKYWISVGMQAAYSDLSEKISNKIGLFHKGKDMFPQHAEYYDSLIDLYTEEYNYCRAMIDIGRQMQGATVQ
jgi:hypothetical protein